MAAAINYPIPNDNPPHHPIFLCTSSLSVIIRSRGGSGDGAGTNPNTADEQPGKNGLICTESAELCWNVMWGDMQWTMHSHNPGDLTSDLTTWRVCVNVITRSKFFPLSDSFVIHAKDPHFWPKNEDLRPNFFSGPSVLTFYILPYLRKCKSISACSSFSSLHHLHNYVPGQSKKKKFPFSRSCNTSWSWHLTTNTAPSG